MEMEEAKGPGVFFLLYTENVVKKCTHVTIINDNTTTTNPTPDFQLQSSEF